MVLESLVNIDRMTENQQDPKDEGGEEENKIEIMSVIEEKNKTIIDLRISITYTQNLVMMDDRSLIRYLARIIFSLY